MECRTVTTFGIFLTSLELFQVRSVVKSILVELVCAAVVFTGPMPFHHLTNGVRELKEQFHELQESIHSERLQQCSVKTDNTNQQTTVAYCAFSSWTKTN